MSDLKARIEQVESLRKHKNDAIAYLFRDCKAEIERLSAELETQKMKRLEAQGMADCMDMVMQELQGAGVIGKDVPPMMLPEAILAKLSAVGEPVAWCFWVTDHPAFKPFWTGWFTKKEDAEMMMKLHPKYECAYTAPPSVDALIAEIDGLDGFNWDGGYGMVKFRGCENPDYLRRADIKSILDKYRSSK